MLRTIAIICLFLTSLVLGFLLHEVESKKRILKEDLIELSKSKYGVFNVDEWKRIITDIVSDKIDEFQFTDANKKELEKKLSQFLYQAIDAVEAGVKANRFSSIKGFFQSAVSWGADLFDNMRNEVPNLSKAILEDLERPETRNSLKKYVSDLIDDYAEDTFSKVNYTTINAIAEKYGESSREELKGVIEVRYNQKNQTSQGYRLGLYAIGGIILVLLLFSGRMSKADLTTALFIALIFLLLGLLLPMIDIDARVSSFSLQVLGESILFENQVLYYKSKSIIEVVVLMLTQANWDVIIVGLLILTFSVLFPVAKLTLSFLCLFKDRIRDKKWVKFFVFKSGKWSMADVLVVAIFMAYIGFTSILTEQLRQLEKLSGKVEILTTNQSNLNTGFFMFFGFVVLSLVVSDKLMKEFSGS